MSDYLMDYGPNWPPKPSPPAPRRRRLSVWQKCGVALVAYGLIWAGGVVLLQVLQVLQVVHS